MTGPPASGRTRNFECLPPIARRSRIWNQPSNRASGKPWPQGPQSRDNEKAGHLGSAHLRPESQDQPEEHVHRGDHPYDAEDEVNHQPSGAAPRCHHCGQGVIFWLLIQKPKLLWFRLRGYHARDSVAR